MFECRGSGHMRALKTYLNFLGKCGTILNRWNVRISIFRRFGSAGPISAIYYRSSFVANPPVTMEKGKNETIARLEPAQLKPNGKHFVADSPGDGRLALNSDPLF